MLRCKIISSTPNCLPRPAVSFWHLLTHPFDPENFGLLVKDQMPLPVLLQKYLKALKDFSSLTEDIVHISTQRNVNGRKLHFKSLTGWSWSVRLGAPGPWQHNIAIFSLCHCKSWTYLSIIILVSDSREAAFVVNSVFRSSSLSCKIGKSLLIKDIKHTNNILENIFFLQYLHIINIFDSSPLLPFFELLSERPYSVGTLPSAEM